MSDVICPLIEKDKSISTDILRLFERTRVAYLSARTDPKEYGSKWRSAVNKIKEAYEMADALSNELKDFIDDDLLEAKDVLMLLPIMLKSCMKQ